MADDDFVLLKELHDPVQAQMLVDLLEQEAIGVSAVGLNHRALLGMVGSFVEIRLRVRKPDLARARELLVALDEGELVSDEALAEEDGETRPHEEDAAKPDRGIVLPRPTHPDPRRKRIAAGAAFIFPGGAHFYARDTKRGVVLLLAYGLLLGFTAAWDPAALWALPLVLLADIFGAFEAVERYNTGEVSRSASARIARLFAWGAPLLAVLPSGGELAVARLAPEVYIGRSGRAVCEHRADCRDEDLAACHDELAAEVRRGDRSRDGLRRCATCLDGLTCGAVWRDVTCEEAPTFSLIFATPMSSCEPGPALRSECESACRGVLPEQGRPSRETGFLEVDPGLMY